MTNVFETEVYRTSTGKEPYTEGRIVSITVL